MSAPTVYDVTSWPHGDPADDIGAVINGMLGEIRERQRTADRERGGSPGAIIMIPPGDWTLRTQVLIDVSFVRIQGAGHGFTSSSIRFNEPEERWHALHELWPGGSRVRVELGPAPGGSASTAPGGSASTAPGAAFLVEREGSPRISSVEFVDFCIDGMRFTADGSDALPANTYVNGRTGIHVASANDSFRVTGMGLVYLEHGLVVNRADALSVHDNFIAECGSCIELLDRGQASKITDNLLGAGPHGHTIHAERHGGLLVAANNVFPRGDSSVRFDGVTRSSITGNRMHSFYPGMVVLAGGSSENLVGANHLLRDSEPWAPFQGVDNGIGDDAGLVRIDGTGNSVIGNHVSVVLDPDAVRPTGATPVVFRVAGGTRNHLAANHVVATAVRADTGESAFAAQVDALLSAGRVGELAITAVSVDAASTGNTVLDCGTEREVLADRSLNAVRATPDVPGAPE